MLAAFTKGAQVMETKFMRYPYNLTSYYSYSHLGFARDRDAAVH